MSVLPCGQYHPQPPRLWRNGLDFEPKKTYPPDYSNVPDVRSWNMSPFGPERFDLDEIQRLEKKGCKAYYELEKLKKKYFGPKDEPCGSRAEGKRACVPKFPQRCYTYQPYGPALLPTTSYSKPECNNNRLHRDYMPPLLKDVFHTMQSPTPCLKYVVYPPEDKFKDIYIPYGPLAEIRISDREYEPMGPTLRPYLPGCCR